MRLRAMPTGTKSTSRRAAGAAGIAVLLALSACSGDGEEQTPAAEVEDEAPGEDPGDATPEQEASSAPDGVIETSSDEETADPSDEQPADPQDEAAAESEAPAPDPETSEGGPAPYPKGEDPCGHLIAEDLTEALGEEIVDTPGDDSSDLASQEERDEGKLVACHFPTDDPRALMLHVNWLRLEVDMPDEMPEDIAAEHKRAMHVNYAKGQDGVQEVEVPGVPEAYANVSEAFGSTQVHVFVPYDDAVLTTSLTGPLGSLDESDIPRAVSAAEVAIDAP